MSYILDTFPTITMPIKAKNRFTDELLNNYTYGRKWNIIYTESENSITIGDFTAVELNSSYTVISITDNGVYIGGCDFSATMKGLITVLEKLKYNKKSDCFYLENEYKTESPLLNFRCVHLCILPETELHFLRKCVRSCVVAKYSHIILEFWGMLKFDCLSELSWPFAYSKTEIKEIVAEANAFGVEIIPMFNHLGHASACREINGKHVVLDQNQSLEYLFRSYGWIWNINRQDVKELLSKIRNELIEICGDGKYFHIGCDEAYAYGNNVDNALELAEYVNEISKELNSIGRQTIIWHDMLSSKTDFPDYISSSTKEVADALINSIDKNIIIADWQYNQNEELWKTSKHFKDCGFNVVCCPWDNKENIAMAIDTVNSHKLYGIIHTTWHTLHYGFREMIYAGVLSYGTDNDNLDDMHRFYCASVARKAMPSDGDFKKSGWSEKMTGAGL